MSSTTRKPRGTAAMLLVARRFGPWFTAQLAAKGLTVAECAAALLDQPYQVDAKRLPAAVQSWADGNTMPRVQALPGLATVLGVDLGVIVAAAGRPAEDAARLRFLTDSATSLPARLAAWREKVGMTPKEAAEFAGVHVTGWYRMEAGSTMPSFQTLSKVADVLGVPSVELAEAAGALPGVDDTLLARCRAFDQPYAVAIRERLNNLSPQLRAQVFERCALPLQRYATGAARPGEHLALRLAELLVIDARPLLEAAGLSVEDADVIAAAFDRQARCAKTVSRQLADIRRKHALTRDALADLLSTHPHPTQVSRWESTMTPTLRHLAGYSRAFPAAAPQLIAAYAAA